MPAIRAKFMEFQIPPSSADGMSLYEVLSTFSELQRMQKGRSKPLADEDFDEMLDQIRAMNLPDVKV